MGRITAMTETVRYILLEKKRVVKVILWIEFCMR